METAIALRQGLSRVSEMLNRARSQGTRASTEASETFEMPELHSTTRWQARLAFFSFLAMPSEVAASSASLLWYFSLKTITVKRTLALWWTMMRHYLADADTAPGSCHETW